MAEVWATVGSPSEPVFDKRHHRPTDPDHAEADIGGGSAPSGLGIGVNAPLVRPWQLVEPHP